MATPKRYDRKRRYECKDKHEGDPVELTLAMADARLRRKCVEGTEKYRASLKAAHPELFQEKGAA